MVAPDHAQGFMMHDPKNWTSLTLDEFKLKTFDDYTVEIAIDACGLCGSDHHSLNGGWGESPLPLCVGHEIIGRAVRVGSKVTKVKKGERVGAGAQIGADLTCKVCKENNEIYCPNLIDTYASEWPDHVKTQGGFSSHIRVHEYFAFTIPDAIETSIAAPMLCAGITTYSPLVRLGAGPGKKVGIVGIGGLGHFAIMWANALQCEVTAFSHTPSKEEDARKLGAHHFIDTSKKDWHKPYSFEYDFLLCTSDSANSMNLEPYFSVLRVGGEFHHVGIPDGPLQELGVGTFVPGAWKMGASHLGNRQEMEAMLKLAADKNIKSWVETIDISEEGLKTALERLAKGDVRYRFTLVNYDKAFGKRD